jgi:glutathione S-transferase
MKVLFTPTSPFARKVRVLAHEAGIHDRIHWLFADPWTSEELRKVNPLGKVPALLLPDGRCLCDSPLICEYLDAVSGHRAFPSVGDARWRALQLQALGDGLCDALVRKRMETLLPAEHRSEAVLARQSEAVDAACTVLDAEADRFCETPTIGEMSVACSLGYIDFRFPDHQWRPRWPHLAHWYARFSERASMQATVPPAS